MVTGGRLEGARQRMQGDILAQGLELMLFGMGTVVLFLGLLVVATAAMSRLLGRYFPEPERTLSPSRQATQPAQPAAADEDAQLVAVISAAIRRHRQRHSR